MKRLLPLLLTLVLVITAIVPAYATGDGNFDGGGGSMGDCLLYTSDAADEL